MIASKILKKIRQIEIRTNRGVTGTLAGSLGGFVALILTLASACGADWHAESLPQYNKLFEQTNDWIGADGDYTVALTNGVTAWLFSDTFIGQVRDGHRVNARMVNNTVALQHGTEPSDTRVEFFHGKTRDGKPKALFTPADGKGWFWLGGGIVESGKLFVFLPQFEHTGDKSVFGFRQIGTWLGCVSNPLAPPTKWQITQSKIPFVKFEGGENRSFGSAVLVTNGFVYIFGMHERTNSSRKMILARVPEAKLDDFASWQFRARDGWSTNVEAATDFCDNMATEYSVSWLPSLQRFVLVYTENGLSEKIMVRTAPNPWGPWSAATMVYRCPEASWNKNILCYTAKAQPMLASTGDELLVTYAANSSKFSDVLDDARLYWPRFVSVRLLSK